MSLSAREQRILSEIERDLTAAAPLLSRGLASMRPGLRHRVAIGKRVHQPRGSAEGQRWVIAMIAGLLAGLALLSAGLVLNVVAMMIGGAALTQLSLAAGWLARALRARRPAGYRG